MISYSFKKLVILINSMSPIILDNQGFTDLAEW